MTQDIFSDCDYIAAGFSTKPFTSDILRNEMVSNAAKTGGCVIKPCLVHGNAICRIRKEELTAAPYIEVPETDGLVTDIPGVFLTSTHGDCLPLYALDPVLKAVGLAHAGWKGTALGIAFCLAETMKKNYGCRPENIRIYIGPGIDRCHFEFKKDDAEEFFFSRDPKTRGFAYVHSDPDKLYLDLKNINRYYFEKAGIKRENIEISPECTFCLEDRYYSYRRSKDRDRMLAYIKING